MIEVVREMPRGPALHLRSKVREGDAEEARALVSAIEAVRGIPRALPVVWGGRWRWTLAGMRGSPDVYVRREAPDRGRRGPAWCGWSTYTEFEKSRALGRTHVVGFRKALTTTGVGATWYDAWPTGTIPAVGAYGGAAFTAKQLDDLQAGALWHNGDASPGTKHVSSMMTVPAASTPTLILYDRVLTYEACTFTTSNQVFTNTLPALRHVAAGMFGLEVCVTCQTVLGATASNLTQLQFTDQAGNTLVSMPTTPTVSHIVSAAAPTSTLGARVVSPADSGAAFTWGPFLDLGPGVTGARLVDNWTWSGANTGTLCVVLLHVMVVCPQTTAAVGTLVDQVVQTTALERVFDGACLSFLTFRPATGSQAQHGVAEFTWS